MCFAVVCVILTLGLWPFHTPQNQVTWLKRGGVHFDDFGTILGPARLNASPSDAASFEVWARPDHWTGSATFLSLYRHETGLLFALRQSLTDLEVTVDAPRTRRHSHFYADEVLSRSLKRKQPVFLSVVSGPDGTTVYLDGEKAKTAPGFAIPASALTGRLIVGDVPGQSDSLEGDLRGLAIYAVELNAAEVMRHYRTWIQNGAPQISSDECNIALYLFDEGAGSTIRNRAAPAGDLRIPANYLVVDKIALEPFWKEFNFSRSYWSGIVKNIIGFVPVGFSFYAYFVVAANFRRAALATVLIGALISITIEVLQAFLPTRDSGTTDIFTNTLGTWLGVMLYRDTYPLVLRRFPNLDWFARDDP